jgi:hypothetical protein
MGDGRGDSELCESERAALLAAARAPSASAKVPVREHILSKLDLHRGRSSLHGLCNVGCWSGRLTSLLALATRDRSSDLEPHAASCGEMRVSVRAQLEVFQR